MYLGERLIFTALDACFGLFLSCCIMIRELMTVVVCLAAANVCPMCHFGNMLTYASKNNINNKKRITCAGTVDTIGTICDLGGDIIDVVSMSIP